MKNALKELSIKIDKLQETQLKILATLEQRTVQAVEPAKPTNKLTKKEKPDKIDLDFITYFLNKERIKSEFNLVATPSCQRVLTYLKNNDPSIFDGFKRKD